LSQTTYGYDTHGHQQTVTDARNGTTTYGYNDADQVTSVTTPAPGTGQAAQTTGTEYDELGRPKRIVYPDGASVTNEYWPTGEIKRTYGSSIFPVGCGTTTKDA
jgi:YD repeat-containing protein